jgi:uncharacterized integral membrane protein
MVDRPEPRPANRWQQVRLAVAGVLGILLLIFAFQNRDPVSVDFIFFTREPRLIYIILGSAILGAIAGSLVRRSRARGRGRDHDRD